MIARTLIRLALSLVLGPSLLAQNGSNFLVLNNGMDVLYAGLGAGGSQVAGTDGIGSWLDGENMRGNTLTTLGDFGFKEVGFRETVCVLGPPIAGLALRWPLITLTEFDGVNPFGPGNVFTRFFCPTSGCFPLGGSAGFMPYGVPGGSSASFLVAGLPSAAGLPSNATQLIPNLGLVPSSNGGTATLIGLASANLSIGSTGFCWVVQFNWAPSAVASLDDIGGWWRWRTSSPDNNQYWSVSNDELNLWQSQSVSTDAGQAALMQFFANVDLDVHHLSSNPVTNDALAPVGFNGTGVYYGIGAGVPNSGNSLNGGFDMGRHSAWAFGQGGVVNPVTGLGNQDPLGSPTAGLIQTLGFVSFSNSAAPPIISTFRVAWLQVNFDLAFGVDPALAGDAIMALGAARFPLQIPASLPSPWLQPVTTLLAPLWVHDVPLDLSGLWPDPNGQPGGSMGVSAYVGSTIHLPLPATGGFSLGVPLGFQTGSSGLGGPTGPIMASIRGKAAPSNTATISGSGP